MESDNFCWNVVKCGMWWNMVMETLTEPPQNRPFYQTSTLSPPRFRALKSCSSLLSPLLKPTFIRPGNELNIDRSHHPVWKTTVAEEGSLVLAHLCAELTRRFTVCRFLCSIQKPILLLLLFAGRVTVWPRALLKRFRGSVRPDCFDFGR